MMKNNTCPKSQNTGWWKHRYSMFSKVKNSIKINIILVSQHLCSHFVFSILQFNNINIQNMEFTQLYMIRSPNEKIHSLNAHPISNVVALSLLRK